MYCFMQQKKQCRPPPLFLFLFLCTKLCLSLFPQQHLHKILCISMLTNTCIEHEKSISIKFLLYYIIVHHHFTHNPSVFLFFAVLSFIVHKYTFNFFNLFPFSLVFFLLSNSSSAR